jgi:hypothetical protein
LPAAGIEAVPLSNSFVLQIHFRHVFCDLAGFGACQVRERDHAQVVIYVAIDGRLESLP